MRKNDGMRDIMNKRSLRLVLSIGLIAIAAACLFRIYSSNQSDADIVTSSQLLDTINIEELSTAEFKYKGIADVYSDENSSQIRCRVCYNAIIKAGINMKDVIFEVDTIDKVVTATLPDIKLMTTIVDEQSMALLPSDADVGIDRLLKCCKKDVATEARESTELISIARQNLRATIDGLLSPMLKVRGYTIIWK